MTALAAVVWPSSLDPPSASTLPRVRIARNRRYNKEGGPIETIARCLLPSEESRGWRSADLGTRAVHLLGAKDGLWTVLSDVQPDHPLRGLKR